MKPFLVSVASIFLLISCKFYEVTHNCVCVCTILIAVSLSIIIFGVWLTVAHPVHTVAATNWNVDGSANKESSNPNKGFRILNRIRSL